MFGSLCQILVHGSEKATRMLADFAKNTRDIVQGKVFTPKRYEIIDATRESHIFQVRLFGHIVLDPLTDD